MTFHGEATMRSLSTLATTPVIGNVGVQAMYEACQFDFGLGARMCTRDEFYYSPNAVAPSDNAWVDPRSNACDQWTSTTLGSDPLTVENLAGKFWLRSASCGSNLPVTCCAR